MKQCQNHRYILIYDTIKNAKEKKKKLFLLISLTLRTCLLQIIPSNFYQITTTKPAIYIFFKQMYVHQVSLAILILIIIQQVLTLELLFTKFFQFIYLKIYKKYANLVSFRTIISEIFMKNADIRRENRRIVSYFAFIKIVNIFYDYQN